jgi:esterase
MTLKKKLKILLSLFFFSLLSISAFGAPAWPIPEGLKTVEVNGYEMAYLEAGSGAPLLLIHGSLTDYRTWRNQIPELAKSYRTIAVSLRHHYPEKWNGSGDGFTIDQHASDIVGFIKKLDLGKVHLVGHSRGGTVALKVAIINPELIRSVILADGNFFSLLPETPEHQLYQEAWIERGEKARITLAAGNAEKAAQEWINDFAGPGSWEKTPPPIKQIWIDKIWSVTDRYERGKISCAEIVKFNFPILLVTGEFSPKENAEMQNAMRQCKPDIPEPIIVPKGIHQMHIVNPLFFNETVLNFLKQL